MSSDTSKSIFGAHGALFLVNTLYAASHVIAKGVMPDYLTPNVFILLRVVGATVLFWLIWLLGKREVIAKKDIPLVALCALFGVAINQLFFFHGLNLSSSINSGIIMATNPMLVVVLSYFLLKEAISWKRTTGILIGAIGAMLLTLKGGTGKGDSVLGDTFLFINALSYAFYLVLVKPLMKSYSPLTVITYVFSFGMLYVLMFPPTITDLSQTDFSRIPTSAWGIILYVIVGVTFLTYLLTVYGLKYVSPSVSSVYIYIQPVLVIVFTFLFFFLGMVDFTQTITAEKVMYMLMIFFGVYLASVRSVR
jgi:drug/metabolite transporter (DMT)-like permease